MNKDLQCMFRKITLFSTITGLPVILLISILFNNHIYSFLFLAGLLISLMIFILNGIISEFIILKNRINPLKANKIFYIFRIVFVCYLALRVYSINEIYIIPFMLGYCFIFIPILMYGINIAKKGSD